MANNMPPFIEAARQTALTIGCNRATEIRLANILGCSFNVADSMVYRDQVIEVIASPTSAELLITRQVNNNPVVILSPVGQTIRMSNEFKNLFKHLAQVYRGVWYKLSGEMGNIIGEMNKDNDNFIFDNYENGTVPRDLILRETPFAEMKPLLGTRTRGKIIYKGQSFTYRYDGARLLCFKNSSICVECGREGILFRIELPAHHDSPHLNLYAGDGMLMTHDHIIPRSKYEKIMGTRKGLNAQRNLQTMCSYCNMKKADNLPEGII